MEGESGVTRTIIDGVLSSDIQGDQMEAQTMVLLKVSWMKLILVISKEMKWKVKLV